MLQPNFTQAAERQLHLRWILQSKIPRWPLLKQKNIIPASTECRNKDDCWTSGPLGRVKSFVDIFAFPHFTKDVRFSCKVSCSLSCPLHYLEVEKNPYRPRCRGSKREEDCEVTAGLKLEPSSLTLTLNLVHNKTKTNPLESIES